MQLQTSLIHDKAYVTLFERQAQFPFEYYTQTIPRSDACPHGARIDQCAQLAPGARQIDTNTQLRPKQARPYSKDDSWKGKDLLQTELYGTAPFLGRGIGIRLHTDIESSLRTGLPSDNRTRSSLAETPSFPSRNADFINVEPAVEPFVRGGHLTRFGPSYAHPIQQ